LELTRLELLKLIASDSNVLLEVGGSLWGTELIE
jgi:hypothetical protein